MNILLSDEEIEELWEKWEKEDPGQLTPWDDVLCKGQLKRVVEWLQDTSFDAHTTVFQVSTKKWQELQEEIK